jgi:Methyl-accepting chemotaxis protein (MCP) signalling domain
VKLSEKKNSFIKFLPSNLNQYLVFAPLWEDNGEYFGMGVIRGSLRNFSQSSIFIPKKSEKNDSFFLFNDKMLLLEKNLLKTPISNLFPELPKDFLISKKSFFWDKNDNLFVKAQGYSEFEGGRNFYLVHRIPKKMIEKTFTQFKRKLIYLTIFLLVIISILNFFALSKVLSPLKGIIGDLNGSTKIIKNSSHTLNDTSTNWAESTMETASGIETIVISMEGFLKAFHEIKDETEKANHLSKKGGILANSIRVETQKLLDSIKEISTTSKKIEEINKIIGDISFQTNLLALNASVEAARAGDHGRGFAIVAESIRELADKTAQSTDEISKLILESWTKAQKGSRAATNSNEIISEVVGNIEQMSSAVENINNSIRDQFQMVGPMKNGLSLIKNTVIAGTSNALRGSEVSQSLNAQTVKLTEVVENLSETIVGKIN